MQPPVSSDCKRVPKAFLAPLRVSNFARLIRPAKGGMQKPPLVSASRIAKQGRLAPFFLNHPCGQGLGQRQGTCHHALIILPLPGDGGPKTPDQPADQNIAWPMDPDVKPGHSHEDSKQEAKGHKPPSVPFHKRSGPKQCQHGVKRHSHGGVPTRKSGGIREVGS